MNETSGTNAPKKVKGRKRHILVDGLGFILSVIVTATNYADRAAGKEFFVQYDSTRHPHLAKSLNVGTYRFDFAHKVKEEYGIEGVARGRQPQKRRLCIDKRSLSGQANICLAHVLHPSLVGRAAGRGPQSECGFCRPTLPQMTDESQPHT